MCAPVTGREFNSRVELGVGHFEETIQRTIDSSKIISLSNVVYGLEALASILWYKVSTENRKKRE